jgi:hypothetical protein
MERPYPKELNAKLKEAREAAAAGKFRLLESDAILADLLDLDFLVKDLGKQLLRIIEEINPRDYKGRRPPVPSYKKPIFNLELFPFRWKSRIFGCSMYLKFALKEGYVWIVSLHKDRGAVGQKEEG